MSQRWYAIFCETGAWGLNSFEYIDFWEFIPISRNWTDLQNCLGALISWSSYRIKSDQGMNLNYFQSGLTGGWDTLKPSQNSNELGKNLSWVKANSTEIYQTKLTLTRPIGLHPHTPVAQKNDSSRWLIGHRLSQLKFDILKILVTPSTLSWRHNFHQPIRVREILPSFLNFVNTIIQFEIDHFFSHFSVKTKLFKGLKFGRA